MAGAELGRDHRELARQVLDHRVAERFFQTRGQPPAADEARSAEADIEIAEHAARGEVARPGFEGVELILHVAAADHGADRGADDHIRNDAVVLQHPQHADMGKAARRAASEGKADFRPRRSRFRRFRRVCRAVVIPVSTKELQHKSPPRSMIGSGFRADKCLTRLW